ncbi:MAG TPA: signal recognition particle protein [Thermotogales bacterium]|nr:signal recognition particle protein [Thermotogales bacterium]
MLERLQEKFERVFKALKGKGKITEKNVRDVVRSLRISLLEADVNYKVVKAFIDSVLEKAIGEKVLSSLTPDQVFMKIVYDELVKLLGSKTAELNLSGNPAIIMVVGLQGSGKTTTCAKLANLLRKRGRNPALVAADVYRPAAIEQLITLGKSVNVPVYHDDGKDPVEIVKDAVKKSKYDLKDVLILDTAGRLHIDEEMMKELEMIKSEVDPDEILMVVDSMVGQDAVRSAKEFDDRLDLTGFIVTKLDGDARGGVILSIRHVTGKPVKFIGVGEKIEDLQQFHPDRIASRILGMGDILSLVEKVEEVIDKERAKELEKKFKRAEFTLNDFRDQIRQLKKMGPIASIVEMIPGMSKMKVNVDEDELKRVEAIINSMTPEERRNPKIINYSRKKRIAKGSGTTINDVNKLLRSFEELKKLMKMMKKGKLRGIPFRI